MASLIHLHLPCHLHQAITINKLPGHRAVFSPIAALQYVTVHPHGAMPIQISRVSWKRMSG